MIFLILAFIIITFACLPFRKMTFEASAACILFVPIQSSLLGAFVGQSMVLSLCLLLINIGLAYLIFPQSKVQLKENFSELIPNIVWLFSGIIIYQLCLLWPDFISMGERLRDYALLAELIKYPSNPNEPWMNGSPLNYYLYWYKLGSSLSQIFSIEIWQMYHLLQSVTLGLYIAVIYRVCSRIGQMKWFYAIPVALLITFGSNLAGLFYAIDPSGQTWWGPSRVIKGTINEFPAWSFLLGDLHPHYLNLSLLLFIFCGLTLYWEHIKQQLNLVNILIVGLLILMTALWLYNSNAWEVPALGLIVGFSIITSVCSNEALTKLKDTIQTKISFNLNSIYSIILLLILIASLFWSAKSISSGNDPFRLVSSAIPVTSTKDFMMHWGLFMALLIPSFLLRLESKTEQFVYALGFAASLLSSVALPLIVILLVMQGHFAFSRKSNSSNDFFINILGLTALGLLFLPEVFYLDDPYGGENERMNTIFKAYSLNWGLLGCFTAIISGQQLFKCITDQELLKFAKPLAIVIFSALLLPFFISTVKERKSNNYLVKPIAQGLSMIDAQYPGAAEAIKQFARLPDGVTLESQGNPYSMTTHVATLSAKRSYLGWINHVDLLTRNYSETKRRADIASQIYNASNCTQALNLMNQEKIKYVVVGPLERERFGESFRILDGCLNSLIQSQGYTILSAN